MRGTIRAVMAVMPNAGLCASCMHARAVRSSRGSTFVLCGLHANDRRFAKYPPLPVRVCPGHSSAA